MESIKELILQYKEQREIIKRVIKKRRKAIKENEKLIGTREHKDDYKLRRAIAIYESMLSEINYSIKVMESYINEIEL